MILIFIHGQRAPPWIVENSAKGIKNECSEICIEDVLLNISATAANFWTFEVAADAGWCADSENLNFEAVRAKAALGDRKNAKNSQKKQACSCEFVDKYAKEWCLCDCDACHTCVDALFKCWMMYIYVYIHIYIYVYMRLYASVKKCQPTNTSAFDRSSLPTRGLWVVYI